MIKSINLYLLVAILLSSCSTNEQTEKNIEKVQVEAKTVNSNEDELKSEQPEENFIEKESPPQSNRERAIQKIKSNVVNTIPYMGRQCGYDVQFKNCEIIIVTKCQNGDYLSTRTSLQSLNSNDVFKGKKDPREIGLYSNSRANNVISDFSNNGTKSSINSSYLFLVAKTKDKAYEIEKELKYLVNDCK